MKFLLCSIVMFSLCNVLNGQISFENSALELGVYSPCGYTDLGNGISFFDYDNDGWDDITMASVNGDAVHFYKNINGNFVYQNLNINQNNAQNKQVNWVDIDNDGDNDLFITSNSSANRLFLNLGNMVMEEITSTCGMLTENFATYGASWGDYNNDGFLDVFLSIRSYSVPNILYKNNGDNTFTLANAEAGLSTNGSMSFCSAFFDYDNDGDQDIYVSNDKYNVSNILYRNNGDGTFSDYSVLSGTDVSIDAMSVTVDDYDADGWLDIYITNGIEGNVLFKNNGDGTFSDVAESSQTIMNSVGWGAVFLDADNDSDLDLYVSGEHNGIFSDLLSSAFYESNNDGTFNLSNHAVPNDMAISFSNAIGDTDNDGYPEMVVNNINHSNIYLWKNNTATTNNWLKIKLEGTQSNRNGIGSRIEISANGTKQYRYTLCGEGYLAQNSATEIFGLGSAENVDYVKVKWLSGAEDIVYNVNVNQLLNIVEGSTLSLSDQTLGNVTTYPNPVLNELYLKGSKSILNIEVRNILGQRVLQHRPNSIDVQIDMSSLKTGVYFVRVDVENSNETIKIIKR